MNGPLPTAPPLHRGSRAGTVVLRVVLTCVPVLTLGMLAWIPMLRLAIVHRRRRDWLLFSAVAVTSTGSLALAGRGGGENSWQSVTGTVLLLGLAVFVPSYFLAVDLPPRQARATPWPQTAPVAPMALPLGPASYPPPGAAQQDRIERVRAGLDELSAYLQQQDRS